MTTKVLIPVLLILCLIMCHGCGTSKQDEATVPPAAATGRAALLPIPVSGAQDTDSRPLVTVSFTGTRDTLRPTVLLTFNTSTLSGQDIAWLADQAPDQIFSMDPALLLQQSAKGAYFIAYQPALDIDPGQTYRLMLKDTLTIKDKALPIAAEKTFYLKSEVEPGITDIYIAAVQLKQNQLRAVMAFNFTPTDDLLKEHIRVSTPEDQTLPFELKTTDHNGVYLDIRHPAVSRLHAARQPLTITVSPPVKGVNGAITLKKTVRRSLEIPDPKRLIFNRYYPQEIAGKYRLVLVFSDTLLDADIAHLVQIRPNLVTKREVQGSSIILDGDFRPGVTVHLTLKPGLLSQDRKRMLLNGADRDISFRDFNTNLSFAEKGLYVRKGGKRKLKLNLRNVKAFDVEARLVYQNNLHGLYSFYTSWNDRLYQPDNKISKQLFQREIQVQSEANEETAYFLDLDALFAPYAHGLYYLTISTDERSDATWLCVTDTGIVAKRAHDAVHIWTLSLLNGKPAKGAVISLVSENNQLLGRAESDGTGKVSFPLAKDRPGEPFLIFAETADDFAFLALDNNTIDTADYDVSGSGIVRDDYSCYFFSDRNLYRPGDTVHLSGIVRNRRYNQFKTIAQVPLQAKVRDPNYKEFRELTKPLDGQGMVEYALTLQDYQKTGYYTATFMLGKQQVGQVGFQVEEFMPQRIKTELRTEKELYHAQDVIHARLQGLYLFGAPVAKGLYSLTGYLLPARKQIKGLNQYYFGFQELKDRTPLEIFSLNGTLDDQGERTVDIYMSQYPVKRFSQLVLKAGVSEQAGARDVETFQELAIDPFPVYVGLMKEDTDNIKRNKQNRIRGIVKTHDGGDVKGERLISIQAYQLRYDYLYYYDSYYGRHRYKRTVTENLFKQEDITATDGNFTFTVNPGSLYGAYKLVVTDLETQSVTQVTTYPWWWWYSASSTENKPPYFIDLIAEKTTASPGDTIRMVFDSPFTGSALLTCESDKLLSDRWYGVKKGKNNLKVKLPDGAEAYNNVYYTLFLVNQEYRYGAIPLRGYGIANVTVNQEQHRLGIDLRYEQRIKPNSALEIGFKLLNAGEDSRIVVFAVDEGILQIKKFISPDPFAALFARSSLATTSYDMLGLVINEFKELYTGKSGYGYGDEALFEKKDDEGRIQRVKPLARWSGIQEVGPKGKGTVTFQIPNFLGKLRIMAVAVSGDRFGAATGYTVIKDNIQVITTLPRFALAGDTFTVPATIINDTGKAGTFNLTVESENLTASLPETSLALEDKEAKQITIQASAAGNLGKARFHLSVAGNGEQSSAETILPIMPNSPALTEFHLVECPPGTTSLASFVKGWQPRFEATTISLSNLVFSKELGYLRYLVRYPYGCLEQTTSAVFPLLYIQDMALIKELRETMEKNDLAVVVHDGIARILSMFTADGGLSFWPGGEESHLWPTIYACHFLLEAHDKGYSIDESVFNRLSGYIKNQVKKSETDFYALSCRAYGLYVLSRMKHTNKNDLDFFLEQNKTRLSLEAVALLAGAYTHLGHVDQAKTLLNTDALSKERLAKPPAKNSDFRRCFYSNTRQSGIILNMLLDMGQFADKDLRNQMLMSVIQNLRARKYYYYYSTQELVWSLMGMTRLLDLQEAKTFKGYLAVDGKQVLEYTGPMATLTRAGLTAHTLEVVNQGDSPFYALVTVEGIKPGRPFTSYARNISIRKLFLGANGRLLSADDLAHIKQGADIWVKLIVSADMRINNLAIVDRIGAGFEVENPRLVRQYLPNWLNEKDLLRTDYMDIKDYQVGFFTDLRPGRHWVIVYKLKALTSGSFLVPPVAAEAMYEPFNRAASDAVNVQIE